MSNKIPAYGVFSPLPRYVKRPFIFSESSGSVSPAEATQGIKTKVKLNNIAKNLFHIINY